MNYYYYQTLKKAKARKKNWDFLGIWGTFKYYYRALKEAKEKRACTKYAQKCINKTIQKGDVSDLAEAIYGKNWRDRLVGRHIGEHSGKCSPVVSGLMKKYGLFGTGKTGRLSDLINNTPNVQPLQTKGVDMSVTKVDNVVEGVLI